MSNSELLKIMMMITHDENDQLIIYKILQSILLMIHGFPKEHGNIFTENIVESN